MKTIITAVGMRDLIERSKRLESDIMQVKIMVKKAKKAGDLRENSDFMNSSVLLSCMEGEYEELQRQISGLEVKENNDNLSVVGFGNLVSIHEEGDDAVMKLWITGESEHRPSKNAYSHISNLGKRLMGSLVGDIIDFKSKKWRIFKIEK